MLQGAVLDFCDYTSSNEGRTNKFDWANWRNPPERLWHVIAATEGYTRPGRYRLTSTGIGKVALSVNGRIYDFTGAGEAYDIEVTKPNTRYRFQLQATDEANPITRDNIWFHQADLDPIAQPFHPDYLAALEGTWALRSIHYYEIEKTDTTIDKDIGWETADLRRWGEYVDLCNRSGARPWVNLPVKATREYCTELGGFFKRRALRKPIGSWSNEVWNYGGRPYYPAYAYCREQGLIDWGTNSVPRNYARYLGRALDWFEEGFGSRVTRCLEYQVANTSGITAALDESKKAGHRVDMIATAPYLLANLKWDQLAKLIRTGNPEVAEQLGIAALESRMYGTLDGLMKAWYDVSVANRVQLAAYEWGDSITVPQKDSEAGVPYESTREEREAVGLLLAGGKLMGDLKIKHSELMSKYFHGGCHCGFVGKWGGGVNYFGLKPNLETPTPKFDAWRYLVDRYRA